MARLGDVCKKGTSNIAQKDLEGHSGNYPIYGASGFIANVDFYQQDNPYIAVVKDGAGIGRIMKLPAKSSVIGTMQYIIPNDNVDISYLAYAMEHMNLSKYFTGATIPHIYFKDYQKEDLPLPHLDAQRKIAAVLDKISDLIAKRRQQLDKLDELVKSRFIEMFGEPLINPLNWDELTLGDVCSKVVRYPTFYGMKYLDVGVRVIRIGNILPDGRMDTDDKNYVFVHDTINANFSETVIEMNDIIMAVRGDGSAAKRIGIITEPILVGANISPNLIRIKVDFDKLNPIYMFYYLTGEAGQQRLDAFVNKTAKKNIAAKDIVKVIVPIPPMELQEQFVAFVAQTNKEKLVFQKSRDKLETLKKALMQEYFM